MTTEQIKVHEPLTAREQQYLALFASGLTQGEIAQRMGVRASGVTGYRNAVLHKLRLHDKAELRVAVVQLKLAA